MLVRLLVLLVIHAKRGSRRTGKTTSGGRAACCVSPHVVNRLSHHSTQELLGMRDTILKFQHERRRAAREAQKLARRGIFGGGDCPQCTLLFYQRELLALKEQVFEERCRGTDSGLRSSRLQVCET